MLGFEMELIYYSKRFRNILVYWIVLLNLSIDVDKAYEKTF